MILIPMKLQCIWMKGVRVCVYRYVCILSIVQVRFLLIWHKLALSGGEISMQKMSPVDWPVVKSVEALP